jgi:hypothetical protein
LTPCCARACGILLGVGALTFAGAVTWLSRAGAVTAAQIEQSVRAMLDSPAYGRAAERLAVHMKALDSAAQFRAFVERSVFGSRPGS